MDRRSVASGGFTSTVNSGPRTAVPLRKSSWIATLKFLDRRLRACSRIQPGPVPGEATVAVEPHGARRAGGT